MSYLLSDMSLDPEAAALRQRLLDSDPGVRRVALLAFADLEDEALLPTIASLLRLDPEPTLRAEAARALAGWGGDDVVDALADALSDEPSVRQAAALALTELKDNAAGARLVSHASHPDGFICGAALRALRELRVPAAAVPALQALRHADAGVRREAVGVLGWLKHGDALVQLADLAVNDSDAEVRRAAAGALGLASSADAPVVLPALCSALHDPAWAVREEAATTLGKLVGSTAQVGDSARAACSAALREAMGDDYWQVRLRAARSLGRVRDRSALPVLTEALLHPAGNLRKEAAIALGDIGDAEAAPALRAAEADPDPEVRKAVRLALQRLASA
jgi:HEAT repeat protein